MSVNWNVVKPAPADRLARVTRGRPAKAAALAGAASPLDQMARRIRSEYMEMPGLSLTRDQARCLWGLDAELCDRLLAYLMETGFLARTAAATYVRADGR